LNAADEVAVEAFLAGQIGYRSICDIVRETLERVPARTPRTVAEVLEIDRESREQAHGLVEARSTAAV
jgi:1-deoxy-D-xylulose-5-phosphate reductoisomerase